MDELRIGSMLVQQSEMAQYSEMLGVSYPIDEEVKRKMEAEAKARHEKQMKKRRAAMVVDLAQALVLAAFPANPAPAEHFIEAAESFISAAEKYLAEKGE